MRVLQLFVAAGLLFERSASGGTSPVTAVSASGTQLASLTVGGLTYSTAQLAGGTLTAFAAASNGCLLMPAGSGAPAAGSRAGLLGDWSLDSGVINPAFGASVCALSFPQPVVNRPGPDLVFLEINPNASADSMQVTINGVTLPVTSAEWGQTGYATAGAIQFSTATPPTTLAALESASLTSGNAITQNVFGVALDLSDFGVAAGASVSQIAFGSHGSVSFDPVFVGAITGTGSPPAGLVTLPYIEDFSSGPGSFRPSASTEWTVTGGAYRNTITSASAAASSASVQTAQLGGDPLAAPNFFVSGKFTVISSGSTSNAVGLALFGTNATFSGGVANPYYLVEVRPAGSALRVRRIGINETQFLPETSLGSFTLNPALAFAIECAGAYENGVLRIAVTVRQGGASATFYVVDSEPLALGHFGFRNRTNGTALTVDCDDFTLRRLSTIAFTAPPVPFARPGEAYASTAVAESDIGAAVVLAAPAKPAWLGFAPGANGSAALSGVPSAAQLGSHEVTLAASDDSAGTAQQTFHVSVLEPTGVFISEFLADNESGLRDEDGDQSDWIELFNADNAPADVGGWWLSDDPQVPKKWAIPTGVTIPARSFLVVWASGKSRVADPARLHTDFKLSSNAGGFLSLAQPGGAVVSSYASYPAQRADRSYGAYGSYTPRGYLLTPTPGAPNDPVGYAGFVADAQFSAGRGFYAAPQSVTVTCATPGATLVYTLDGSTPTLANGAQASSPLPLSISASTVLRVAAFAPGLAPSGPRTQTFLFLDDVRQQPAAPPAGWPTGRVNGQVLDYGMDTKVTSTVTPQQMVDALAALPALSLVTDLPNLFDPQRGIYVNPYGREEGYECPVSVELLHPDNSPGFQVGAGLRIRGGASREGTNPKHNFHLYFRGEYGASRLDHRLFGNEGAAEFDRVDLRATQVKSWHRNNDGTATYNRDEWSRYTQAAMGHPYTRSRYYHLYLNGRYWGIYGTQERADSAWAASYFGGKTGDYDVLKTYVIPHRVAAADGDATAWTQLFQMAAAGFASDSAYFAVQGLDASGQPSATLKPLLDVDNLIDYTLLNYYIGNGDGPVNTSVGVPKNFYAVRPRDGRFGFRFLAHDCEDAMNDVDVTAPTSVGSTLAYFNPRWLSQQLAANPRYRLRFADRAQKHLFNGGVFDPPVAVARWQFFRNQVGPAMLAESARWGDFASGTPRTVAHFNAANDSIETSFLPNRRATLLAQLRSRGLFPQTGAPAFSQHGGNVPGGFTLAVSGPAGATLYYTLDGSDPQTAGSPVYSSPIALSGAQVTVKSRARSSATGEWSALTEALFSIDAVSAGPGGLAISEIHYNPPGSGDETEFVELVNRSGGRLDLGGVSFAGAMTFTFGNVVLEPGERICVVEDAAAFAAAFGAAARVAGQWTGALNNSGDTLILRDRNGAEIERVAYDDDFPWPQGSGGRSLVRIDPASAPEGAWNWRSSRAAAPSPGAGDGEPFAAWLAAQGQSDPLHPGAAGVPALLRFAVGADLSGEPSALLTVAPEPFSDPPTAAVTFHRRHGADEAPITLQVSDDLETWQERVPGSADAPFLSRQLNGDGTETLSVRIPVSGATFVRLRVVRR